MQIVIDIPQGLKIDFENENWTASTCTKMKDALMNGVILPKGHGRIIDENKIRHWGWNFIEHHAKTDAPTVIEADTESEE